MIHTVHKYAVHFLFTNIKWKTFVVFVRILHRARGSTHKHFCAHFVCLVCLKLYVASEYAALPRRGKQHSAVRQTFGKQLNTIRRVSLLEREATFASPEE